MVKYADGRHNGFKYLNAAQTLAPQDLFFTDPASVATPGG